MIRVLLLSQDLKLQPLLALALGREFELVVEADPARLKTELDDGSLHVLLLDLDSEYGLAQSCIEVFDELSSMGAAIVVMTDDGARLTAMELVQRGAHSYCRKPPALRELKTSLRRAYEHCVMKQELAGKGDGSTVRGEVAEAPSCDALLGGSQLMRNVYDLIYRVADLSASVLIVGESGTGKELIARAIHNLGQRKKHPFLGVACGAIPETLIESELFGHEKGAFTGTTGTRTGYFEQAGSGTLFLDEIGELTPQTQVKLLRVLQQREFSRLGSSRAIPLKARVIFATHRDLGRLVTDGKFRLDFYYRINVMTINAPSLTDRPEDIAPLAHHFLRQYSELYNKRVIGITPPALAMIEEYDWPGNVRELENVIQSAIICADDENIVPKDLPDGVRQQEVLERDDIPQIGSFERLVRDYKVKLAAKAIDDCHGNKTLAARSLNISRAYLHRLIRQEEVETLDAA